MHANGEGLVRLVQSFVHHRLGEKHLDRSSEKFAVSGSEEAGSACGIGVFLVVKEVQSRALQRGLLWDRAQVPSHDNDFLELGV